MPIVSIHFYSGFSYFSTYILIQRKLEILASNKLKLKIRLSFPYIIIWVQVYFK